MVAAKRTAEGWPHERQHRDACSAAVLEKYHKHIIGKAGSNVGRIKDETGVQIRIPNDR